MTRLILRPLLCLVVIVAGGCAAGRATMAQSSADQPPPAPREFRAAWVATVSNIDWPTKPGLSTQQQQQEAIAILDRAKELNLNAIVLQVRTSADAFYPSKYEPWSYFLTGQQGKRPDPYYDPLQFWITESHKRGIQLHAWFNPYRARHGGAKYQASPDHVSRRNPKIVREFNNWQWLDPAEPGAQDLTYNVFMDVVRRYDVDGIHIDDYFYPYPDYLKNADFPDDEPWQRYQKAGGKLSRDDWRRAQVDQLIERVYAGTKKLKRHVQFGISPFGISRPGRPPEVKSGFDQYAKLYADTELWLEKGWLDYWTPQLYWTTGSPQPYEPLLRFWVERNTRDRNLWPGNFTSKLGEKPKEGASDDWTPEELVKQIEITRQMEGATGNVHFSMRSFMRNDRGIVEVLKDGPYREPALVPTSFWLDDRAPNPPDARVLRGGTAAISVRPGRGERIALYAVYTKHGEQWKFHTYPAETRTIELHSDPQLGPVTRVAVAGVDRLGNESRRVLLDVAPQR
jgi:uncharacterized lipoprotein YddW (UPF0748 family)